MIKEESLTVHGTLEAFIMLKTPPGEKRGWGHMETVDSEFEYRLLARMDRSHFVRRPQKKAGGA